MVRALAICTLLFTAGLARADAPRFKFAKGETITYHLVQATQVTEVALDEKSNKPVESSTHTKADLTRQWKVVDVDAKGVATLEMSITAMRWERKANGEEDVFDSSKPDDLNKGEMAKHVGPVLAVLKINAFGQVIDVKESKVGPASRFQAELPFRVILPETEPKAGDSWERAFTIQLDPPLGTGEKYAAKQTYTRADAKTELLAIKVTTELKDQPASAAERIPLLPSLSEGALYFHADSGRYYAARLKIQKEIANHQGDGSSYKFVSTYVEDLVPVK